MSNKSMASDKVYNFIIEKIKSKEWVSNSKIMTENELCEELSVSRIAVRQAIGKLAALGFLVKKQGSGTYVASIEASTYMNYLSSMLLIDEKDMISVLEFRIYFEYGNVLIFMKNHDSNDIQQLDGIYNEMKMNVQNPQKFYVLDAEFHKVIALGTKNPIIIKISEILTEILQKHQSLLYENIGPDIGVEYHGEILKAMKAGDTEIAGLYMKRHIEATIEEVSKVAKHRLRD